MDIKSIVDGLENFYEVWSDGVSGNINEVQAKLADMETISLQTAKRIVKTPSKLREESSKGLAQQEADWFQTSGLKCKLVHVGPKKLNQFTSEEIEAYVKDVAGDLDSAYVKEVKPGTHALYGGAGRIFFDYDETEFYLYLASLRYLSTLNKIKT